MRSVFLCALFVGALTGQVEPDAVQLIGRSTSALERFRTVEIETENTANYVRTSKPLTIRASLLWSGPNKVRLTIGSETAGETIVSYEGVLTKYSKLSREYSREEGTLSLAIAQGRALAGLFAMSAANRQNLVTARILREEKLSADKADFDCSVIEVEVRPDSGPIRSRSYLLWIDKGTGVPLKQQLRVIREEDGKRTESVSTLVVRRMLLDAPIDDNVFEFAPPPGSKLTEGKR